MGREGSGSRGGWSDVSRVLGRCEVLDLSLQRLLVLWGEGEWWGVRGGDGLEGVMG